MAPAFSIYLDLVRFVAACLVVVYHSNSRLIVESPLPFSQYGHSAVIIFFVLSGYVIAFTTATKERNAKVYWASRLSRVLSLALPAVLLTPLLDLIGEALAPALYAGNTTHGLAWLRVMSSLLFLNEIWSVSIMSFSNIAYWSLNYEVWYYVLFSIYIFGSPSRRWAWIGLVAALIGPKILLLAPVWSAGVLIYRWQGAQRMPEWSAWLGLVASFILFYAFEQSRLADLVSEQLKTFLGTSLHRELAFSKWVFTDYLLTLIVCLNFVCMRRIARRYARLALTLERPVRAAASYTFSIYLLHQPLIYFWAALIDLPPTGYVRYAAVMAGVFASIVLIGSLTERRRFALRQYIFAILSRIEASGVARRWIVKDPSSAGLDGRSS